MEIQASRIRVAATLGGALIMAPASYVGQMALGAWGVLDPFSIWLGKWLKIHVSASAAGWTIASLFFVLLYALLVWFIWRKRAQQSSEPDDGPIAARKDAHIQIGQIGEADLRNNETGSRPLLQSDKVGKLRASGNRLGQSQGRDHDEEKK